MAIQKSLQALQDAVASHSNLPQEHCAHTLREIQKLKDTAKDAAASASRERERRVAVEETARKAQQEFDAQKKQDAGVMCKD